MPISADQFARAADRIPGLGSDPGSVRQRIEAMERLLERAFVIPGTDKRFGVDLLLNIIPVAGSAVGAALLLL